jgi:hypothetical protein
MVLQRASFGNLLAPWGSPLVDGQSRTRRAGGSLVQPY